VDLFCSHWITTTGGNGVFAPLSNPISSMGMQDKVLLLPPLLMEQL